MITVQPPPHSDAIVIAANIGSAEVRTLLVNNESSYNILFLEVFSRMGIDSKEPQDLDWRLVGFTDDKTPVVGMITLPLTVGERLKVSP